MRDSYGTYDGRKPEPPCETLCERCRWYEHNREPGAGVCLIDGVPNCANYEPANLRLLREPKGKAR